MHNVSGMTQLRNEFSCTQGEDNKKNLKREGAILRIPSCSSDFEGFFNDHDDPSIFFRVPLLLHSLTRQVRDSRQRSYSSLII